ncbi:hypothetical protein D3C75_1249150 [compost metagenome]
MCGRDVLTGIRYGHLPERRRSIHDGTTTGAHHGNHLVLDAPKNRSQVNEQCSLPFLCRQFVQQLASLTDTRIVERSIETTVRRHCSLH